MTMKLPWFPWPVPACFGCALGIMLANGQLFPGLLLLAVAVLLAFLQPRPHESLLLLAAFAAVGGLRMWHWQQRSDPLAEVRLDSVMQLGGHSDGTVLDVDWPIRASLWISPAGSLPVGEVALRGRVRRAEGKRNPGGFDFASHLAARGVAGTVLVEELQQTEPARPLRLRLRAALREGLEPRAAALAEALTLGERSELGDMRDTFAASGLSHLLSLSGLHLSVLIGFTSRLLLRAGPLRRPMLAGLVIAFVAVVGVSASLLRATLMALAYLAGDWAGSGRADGWTSLALAALLSLVWRPVWLFDLSFQLSYLCLIGLLACSGRLLASVRGLPWWHPKVLLLAPLGTSLAAQLPTLSLLAGTFGTVPLFAAAINLPAIPLASLLVPLCLLAALLGLLSPLLAWPLKQLIGPVADGLLAVADFGARLPAVPWGEVSAFGHWYWGCACLLLLLLFNRVQKPGAVSLGIACIMAASFMTPSGRPPAELVAFDVGQGDSFLLSFTTGPDVLVDAGGNAWSDYDPGERVVVPALRALGVTGLDLLVATHADADHIGGMPAVLDAIPVQLLAVGVMDVEAPLFRELLAAAERNSVPVRSFERGESITLGDLELAVLNPGPSPTGESNEDSLALAVSWQGRQVAVMPGEVSAATEEKLALPPAGVLTVPHHGSRFSSSDRLLRAVGGHTAVISVGSNNYGHPHPDVLERLGTHGYEVYLTRTSGAVRIPLLEGVTAAGTR